MKTILCFFLLLTVQTVSAQLYSRAGGTMVYDSDYDITWLADANYAKTSNYDTQPGVQLSNPFNNGPWDGRMTFDEANQWANNLVYGGFSDWRLPSAVRTTTGALPAAGSWNNTNDSELAHMTDLVMSNPTINLFYNLQTTMYWSQNASVLYNDRAWMTFIGYNTNTGNYFMNYDVYEQTKTIGSTYAWAVRSGDVAAVPLPFASWFFAPALAWLVSFIRFKPGKI